MSFQWQFELLYKKFTIRLKVDTIKITCLEQQVILNRYKFSVYFLCASSLYIFNSQLMSASRRTTPSENSSLMIMKSEKTRTI